MKAKKITLGGVEFTAEFETKNLGSLEDHYITHVDVYVQDLGVEITESNAAEICEDMMRLAYDEASNLADEHEGQGCADVCVTIRNGASWSPEYLHAYVKGYRGAGRFVHTEFTARLADEDEGESESERNKIVEVLRSYEEDTLHYNDSVTRSF